MTDLYWIDWRTGRASPCFGIVVRNGRVIEAANIAKWTTGKPWDVARDWYEKRGAKIVRCGGGS